MQKGKRYFFYILGFAFLFLSAMYGLRNQENTALAGSEHNLSGWAWSDMPDGSDQVKNPSGGTVGRGAGWISFNSTNQGGGANYGVTVASNGRLSGYAWSENIGWITFNQSELGGCPTSPCQANFNDDSGAVTGWAKALSASGGWDGWISLSGSNYGVSANQCSWQGWAWGSDVVGWISFSGSNYGVNASGDACTAFAATLSALPSSGYAPLSTTLTAGVAGGTGTINYTFWWNCSSGSSNVSTVTGTCGNPNDPAIGAKFDGVSETSKNVAHIYSAVGSYTAKVIVERGTRADEERISISANQPPEDFSLSSSKNIEAFITSAPLATSTKTAISILPLFGYSSPTAVSIDVVTPALAGAIYHLKNKTNGQESSGSLPSITLTSGQFSAGADFWARIPRDSVLQEYTIRLKGEGGGKIRFVDVKLNAQAVSPDFKEI